MKSRIQSVPATHVRQQADAVLKIVKKKLKKVHVRIDRQEGDHRNLFLAYFELKARLGKEAD